MTATATEILPAFLLLSQRARDVGLLVACLRPHHGSGGASFDVELFEPDGALWLRVTWAPAELVERAIEKYGRERGGRELPLAGPPAIVRCARRGCPAKVTVRPGDPIRLIEGWTFDDKRRWRCPADSPPIGAQAWTGEVWA